VCHGFFPSDIDICCTHVFYVHQNKTRGVPNLIDKVPTSLSLADSTFFLFLKTKLENLRKYPLKKATILPVRKKVSKHALRKQPRSSDKLNALIFQSSFRKKRLYE
ncbi:hypothetical protein, partial [Enterococcus asini]|uniref:hypothetical protein n=1 Tax=Enterococcus asini TaxID=57732 RepID=UPI001C6FD335